ncbi:ATP-binding protein [Adlercreutzia sp. ZJ473]|uniref:ATP-binding protein n=1 Tax=Adlercreutzia sp. ZJ473 TaxID=2722822 RepID=UPI0015538D87|nr:ATP-binding protein [Adlercreutzia sp. ZJ473]
MNLGHEDEQREFKRSTSEMKEAMASIASILNKHGEGELYFGVRRDGEVCGQDVSESTLREISQAVGNHIEPSIYPSVTHERTPEGKDYVKVAFRGDAAPYSCAGRYRIRVADEDVLMSPDELRLQFREVESSVNPWDGRVSGKTVSDVDEETLRKFVERGQGKGRIPFGYTNAKDVLERLGLLDGDNLRNAAVVLFCPSIYTGLKMGILATHARTDILDLRQEAGVFFDLVDKAEWYIITNTRNRVDTFTSGPSPVYPEIPRDALREGLMNAFAHRDWQTTEAVVIDIYNDAVEILSPGWFIKGQDPDKHLSGESKSSITRNPLISRTLYRSGDIEAYGTGIKRIKDLCDEAGIEVEYVRTVDGTNLVFHRNDPFGRSMVVDAVPDNPTSVGTNVGINVGIKDVRAAEAGLSRTEFAVLSEIIADPHVTAAEAAAKLGLTERSIERAIRGLREKSLIKREGSRKSGAWVVIGEDE